MNDTLYHYVEAAEEKYLQDLVRLFDLNPVSEGRTAQDIQRMLKHTDLFIGCCDQKSGVMIGCARILTDYVYKAWIFDVRVLPEYQKKGVGRMIISTVLNHPQLKDVKNFDLICRTEFAPFYQGFGFRNVRADREYLRLTR